MAERLNTIVCTLQLASPKITAFEIHEWIYHTLRIPEQGVTMIQVDGIRRQVYIKLVNDSVQKIFKDTNAEAKYKYHTGEVSTVGITVAGLGTKRVRVANLPPEVPDTALRTLLAPNNTAGNVDKDVQVSSLERDTSSDHNVDKAHPVPFDCSRKQSPIIL